MKPQQVAQKVKAGRGWLIVRNSGTLADTDYERVADEIVSALNDRQMLIESLQGVAALIREGLEPKKAEGALYSGARSSKRDTLTTALVKAEDALRALAV